MTLDQGLGGGHGLTLPAITSAEKCNYDKVTGA